MLSNRVGLIFIRENGKTRGVSCDELEQRFGESFLGDVLDTPDAWHEPVTVDAGAVVMPLIRSALDLATL